MMATSYKLYMHDSKLKEYQPPGSATQKGSWTQDYKAGKVSNYAPFGTSNEPTTYATSSRPQTAQSSAGGRGQEITREISSPQQQAYKSYAPQQEYRQQQQSTQSNQPKTDDYLFKIFRDKCASRGTRGILSIARLFRIIDDDNSKTLSLPEFTKVLKDLRFDFGPQEVKRLFELFDINRNGVIDYDEFLEGVRGPMPENRVKIVKLAFNKLDADGSGVITIEDLRGMD